jgi:hypothetical protein
VLARQTSKERYRLTAETLLGLNLEVDHPRIAPCMPAIYHIAIRRVGQQGQTGGVTVDGTSCPDMRIALIDDRRDHSV